MASVAACSADHPADGRDSSQDAATDALDGSLSTADVLVSGDAGAPELVWCSAPSPATSSFPIHRECSVDSDCTVVMHQMDCCGTVAAVAVSTASAASFAQDEAACASAFPHCGCFSNGSFADDGTQGTSDASARARCLAGRCTSTLGGDGIVHTCAEAFVAGSLAVGPSCVGECETNVACGAPLACEACPYWTSCTSDGRLHVSAPNAACDGGVS